MSFKISKITLAVNHAKEMADFYNTVFDCQLKEFEAFNSTLYSGNFCGINLLICPNQIAGVEAQQNRQQFDIEVNDIEKVIKIAISNGGKLFQEITTNETSKTAAITDPDGNSIVLIETI